MENTAVIPQEQIVEVKNYISQAQVLKADVMSMVVTNEKDKAAANEMLSATLKPMFKAVEEMRKAYSLTLRRRANEWDAECNPVMGVIQKLIDHLNSQVLDYVHKEEEAARQLQEEANRIAAEAEVKRQEELRLIEEARAKAEEEGKPLPELPLEPAAVATEIAPAVSRTIRTGHGTSSIRKTPTPVIFDESLLPREYLIPNVPMINRDVKDGKKIPGTRLDMIDSLATRGGY